MRAKGCALTDRTGLWQYRAMLGEPGCQKPLTGAALSARGVQSKFRSLNLGGMILAAQAADHCVCLASAEFEGRMRTVFFISLCLIPVTFLIWWCVAESRDTAFRQRHVAKMGILFFAVVGTAALSLIAIWVSSGLSFVREAEAERRNSEEHARINDPAMRQERIAQAATRKPEEFVAQLIQEYKVASADHRCAEYFAVVARQEGTSIRVNKHEKVYTMGEDLGMVATESASYTVTMLCALAGERLSLIDNIGFAWTGCDSYGSVARLELQIKPSRLHLSRTKLSEDRFYDLLEEVRGNIRSETGVTVVQDTASGRFMKRFP